MMNELQQALYQAGFDRIAVLEGSEAGIPEKRLILCFSFYQGADATGPHADAVIHPYYPVSQRSYRIAKSFVSEYSQKGWRIRLDNHIRIKSILDRLPFLQRGRNTLSYMNGIGSRFHIQIMTSEEEIPVTDHPEEKPHSVFCGDCRKCLAHCPGKAISETGFSKEKCLRFWMLNGLCPPEEIMEKMGNRLIGCDECENCCPHNAAGSSDVRTVSLKDIIAGNAAGSLREMIGSNYARKNRLQIQGCSIAASMKRKDLISDLARLAGSENEEVRKAASKAIRIILSESRKTADHS